MKQNLFRIKRFQLGVPPDFFQNIVDASAKAKPGFWSSECIFLMIFLSLNDSDTSIQTEFVC